VPSKARLGRYQGRLRRRIGMIPGYVFTRLDPRLDFEQLLDKIVGALDMVRTRSGNPWMIPERYIREIRKIEIGLNTPPPERKVTHGFKRGQRVRFVDTLVDVWPPGVIERLANDGRIGAEVDLMGRKLMIWVFPHQIEPM
jgi:transcription antitermination factor NusG